MNTKKLHSEAQNNKKSEISLRPFVPSRFRAFALSCLFLPLSLSAQDWKADLERACRVYNSDNLELEMELHFFTSPAATVPAAKETVSMYRAGDNYRVRQFGTDMIRNDRYMVLIDEEHGIIGVERNRDTQPPDEISPETRQEFRKAVKELITTLGIDTVFSQPRFSSENRGKTGGSQVYRFFYTQGKYTESTVYLSTRTGLLEKVSCLLRDPVETEEGIFSKVRVDFLFIRQESGRKPDKSLFSTDPVFTVNANGEAVLKEKYKGYRLIINE